MVHFSELSHFHFEFEPTFLEKIRTANRDPHIKFEKIVTFVANDSNFSMHVTIFPPSAIKGYTYVKSATWTKNIFSKFIAQKCILHFHK